MNRFYQTDHDNITDAEEGAMVWIAYDCGLTAPAPAVVWELILHLIRREPQMRLKTLAYTLEPFAPGEQPEQSDSMTLGDVLDRCENVVRMVNQDFLNRN